MEAGADFTDGLHLRDGGWELSIRPDANASALQVEANAPDAAAESAHNGAVRVSLGTRDDRAELRLTRTGEGTID